MPILLILGPIVGIAAIAVLVAHASHRSAPAAATAQGRTTQFELDHGMPEALVHRVLSALVEDADAASLDALAHELEPTYPLAAAEVRTRAAALRPAAPIATGAPSAPRTARRGAVAAVSAGATPDLSEAALVLQAAMKAYAEETDPIALEGFADSIRTKFPTGAILLFGRARELQAARAAASGGTASSPATPGPMSLALPSQLAASPAHYVVQPGDTPTLIAERLTRDGKRWPELVAANPDKPRSADGSFASLRQGETLAVPPTWAATLVPTHASNSHAEAPR